MGLALRSIGLLALLCWQLPSVHAEARRFPPPRPPILQVAGAEVPVRLTEARIDSRVMAGLGETTIELTFHNPNARVLEGQLAFPLAAGQQVAGFALDIGGELRDAVPVPKAQGRQVFEAIERRQVDPGLLEQTAGNQFRLRLYPIPARGERRVRLVLRDSLPTVPQGLQWSLPVFFARQAEQVTVRLEASGTGQPVAVGVNPLGFTLKTGAYAAQWQGRGADLPAHLQWSLPLARSTDVVTGLHEGQRYLLASVPVRTSTAARVLPRRIGLLWDASGSAGTRNGAAERAVLDRYFQAFGSGQVQLTVLRDRSETPREFTINKGDWSALREYLRALPNDGASALGDWTPNPAIGEYLLVSDGLANYGSQTLPTLSRDQRLYALSSAGAKTDTPRLRAWTSAHHGQLLQVSSEAEVPGVMPLLLQQPVEVGEVRARGVEDVNVDASSATQGWIRVTGRVLRPDATVLLSLRGGGSEPQPITLDVADARVAEGGLVAHAWANARLGALAADPAGAPAAKALSQQFGVVTADTSLLVLETLEDYLRYGIRPPAPLRAAYDQRHAVTVADVASERKRRLDGIARQFAEREQWWNTRWPKDAPPRPKPDVHAVAAPVAMAMAAPPPAPAAPMAPDRVELTASAVADEAEATTERRAKSAPKANNGQITLTLAPWAPDSAYARRLRDAKPAQLYPLYLQEREQHAGSSAFYLDVADLLLASGQRDLALRVLSNLAEMELENRHVLRVLGYRLMQAKAPALAVPVFRQVLAMGEEEPQSFRDLGLALEAAGEYQAAVASLYEVVVRPWDGRFDGISLIALDELTRLIARERVDASAIDPRLRRAMPLDLRVVLSWDSDNSDMDLWVTDPNGERAYYGNRLTYQGGQMSQDFTGGYGPEQFSLRDAKPGIYKIEANYFGSREQLVTGPTTLMLRLSTKWGSRDQRDQQVTLRLKDRAETVLVGEFEVK
ncbi:VIT domain-containing protein [Stenotrophomonas sp. TWI1149]|uniref:VIT domain-containing protein n=1 Tax=unclassified Stenotrophomonas TaxID=196198 RepID=UPI00320B3444